MISEKRIKTRVLETASRAMVSGVKKEVDFDQAGEFVEKRLDKELRGDELSIEIYKEIARRQEERLKANEATP